MTPLNGCWTSDNRRGTSWKLVAASEVDEMPAVSASCLLREVWLLLLLLLGFLLFLLSVALRKSRSRGIARWREKVVVPPLSRLRQAKEHPVEDGGLSLLPVASRCGVSTYLSSIWSSSQRIEPLTVSSMNWQTSCGTQLLARDAVWLMED